MIFLFDIYLIFSDTLCQYHKYVKVWCLLRVSVYKSFLRCLRFKKVTNFI